MEKDSIVLYRKGFPTGRSAWFDNIVEAARYDGETLDEFVYFLVLDKHEFNKLFRANGVGYTLLEGLAGEWDSLSVRVRRMSNLLVERFLY